MSSVVDIVHRDDAGGDQALIETVQNSPFLPDRRPPLEPTALETQTIA